MILIHGNSNSNISVIKNDIGYLVKKKSTDHNRLIIQATKQNRFNHFFNTDDRIGNIFDAPKILDIADTHILMKYYNGNSILDIIEFGKTSDLDTIINNIYKFIDWEFESCILESIDKTLIIDKINSVKSYDTISSKLLYDIPETIYTGRCHGDFTFSNMIFSDKIILIDFLNTYLDSPIQDMCKIEQELNLKWTTLMSTQIRDRVKINIGYNYLKSKLNKKFKVIKDKYNINDNLYKLFYVITILRLLPYTTNKYIYNIILAELRKYD